MESLQSKTNGGTWKETHSDNDSTIKEKLMSKQIFIHVSIRVCIFIVTTAEVSTYITAFSTPILANYTLYTQPRDRKCITFYKANILKFRCACVQKVTGYLPRHYLIGRVTLLYNLSRRKARATCLPRHLHLPFQVSPLMTFPEDE